MSNSNPVVEALKKVKIRYPGEVVSVSLTDLIRENRLTDYIMKYQYPDMEQSGGVQFIPQLRGFSDKDPNPGRYFLQQNIQQQHVREEHGSNIAGVQHEIDVQDMFATLRNSELLKDRSLIVMHNMKKETIRHTKLKKCWTNEFDLIVADNHYGIFICEIKQKSYDRLKEGKGKKYNLEIELKKQEKRYQLLSQVRSFYVKQIPIHTVLICNCSQNYEEESKLIDEESGRRNDEEYKFILDLNLGQNFSSAWGKILDQLNLVASPIRDNISGFTALLYAIQSIYELLPSVIHNKFINNKFQLQNNKENDGAKSILWSREQREILDYVDNCFNNQGADCKKLRICITGCMGSGKTLLLIKFAEIFSSKFPGYKILFLINCFKVSLLLQRLPNCPQLNINNNITFGTGQEYMYSPHSSDTQTFLQSCKPYKLILVDEYWLDADVKLDVSFVDKSHIALVTSRGDTADRVPDFNKFSLSGSLRSTKNITEYVMKFKDSVSVPVTPAHNISYRPVITTNFTSGEQCIAACIACMKQILHNDRNESIMVISTLHRWFLYKLSMRLQDESISHHFKMHSTSGSSATSTHHVNNSSIVLCDPHEANGWESSTVVYVIEGGDPTVAVAGYFEEKIEVGEMHALVAGLYARQSVSRGTTQAFVYNIDSVYTEYIPIISPTPSRLTIPCYEYFGVKNREAFTQDLKRLANTLNSLVNTPKSCKNTMKKILVTYEFQQRSMMENIAKSLPDKLRDCVVFIIGSDNPMFDTMDLSKHFMLLLECYTYVSCFNTKMFTTLPVKTIKLIADQET